MTRINHHVTRAMFLSATESTHISKNSKKTLQRSFNTCTLWSISKYSLIATYSGCKLGSNDQKNSGVSNMVDERLTSTLNLKSFPDFFKSCSLFNPRVPYNASLLGSFVTDIKIGEILDSNLDNFEDCAIACDSVSSIMWSPERNVTISLKILGLSVSLSYSNGIVQFQYPVHPAAGSLNSYNLQMLYHQEYFSLEFQ